MAESRTVGPPNALNGTNAQVAMAAVRDLRIWTRVFVFTLFIRTTFITAVDSKTTKSSKPTLNSSSKASTTKQFQTA